jgi:glucose-1-phosphatase
VNNPPTLAALLFDLGNVVIGIDPAQVVARWAAEATCSPELLADRFHTDEAYRSFERGEISPEDYFAHVRELLGVPLSQAQLEAGWTSLFTGIVPGVDALLRRAAERLPMYALTNSNTTHHAAWSRIYAETLSVFTEVFCSFDLGAWKPEAAAFDLVAARTGIAREAFLFFDDTIVNVEAAQALGIPAVHVQGPDDIQRALNDYRILTD